MAEGHDPVRRNPPATASTRCWFPVGVLRPQASLRRTPGTCSISTAMGSYRCCPGDIHYFEPRRYRLRPVLTVLKGRHRHLSWGSRVCVRWSATPWAARLNVNTQTAGHFPRTTWTSSAVLRSLFKRRKFDHAEHSRVTGTLEHLDALEREAAAPATVRIQEGLPPLRRRRAWRSAQD